MGLRRFIGTASQRAASTQTGTAGDLFYESDTNALGVADGTTLLANLKRFLRLGEAEPTLTRSGTAGNVLIEQANGTFVPGPVSVATSQVANLGAETNLLRRFRDVSGRVDALTSLTGVWTFAKGIVQPDGSVPINQLAATVQSGIAKVLPAETNLLRRFTDAAGRVDANTGTNGVWNFFKGLTVPNGSILAVWLETSAQGGLPKALPVETGLAIRNQDSTGKILGPQTRTDGRTYGKGIGPPGGAVVLSSTSIVDTVLDANGNDQICVTNRSTGKTILLTSVGRNVAPTLATINGVESVIYRSDANTSPGSFAKYFVPVTGGTPVPLKSLIAGFYTVGDSLTAATNSNPTGNQAGGYPFQLAVMLGVSHVNLGSGGQNADQISARVGGTPATVTFSSNTIAATTSAQTVSVSVDLYYGGVGAFSDVGTIAGVHGRLASGGTSGALTAYTFTRDTAGTAVVLSGATNFIPDVGIANATQMTGIWQGRNGYFTMAASQIVADDQSIIDHLTPLAKRYWLLAIPPWQGEETTTPANMAPGGVRKALDDANIAKAANAGTFWVNSTNLAGSPLMIANPGLSFAHSYQFLQTSLAFTIANARYPACPATPTTQDTTDITNGIIPTSFRTNTSTTTVDPGHLNEYGYYLMAYLTYQFITSKGWLL